MESNIIQLYKFNILNIDVYIQLPSKILPYITEYIYEINNNFNNNKEIIIKKYCIIENNITIEQIDRIYNSIHTHTYIYQFLKEIDSKIEPTLEMIKRDSKINDIIK